MMLATEVEFSGQLYLVMRRLKWWLLVVRRPVHLLALYMSNNTVFRPVSMGTSR